MSALLQHMVAVLVQHPDDVRISSRDDGHGGTVWELRVAPDDFPRVIGRGGRTARALRAVLEASHRGPVRPSLNIVDPEDDGGPV